MADLWGRLQPPVKFRVVTELGNRIRQILSRVVGDRGRFVGGCQLTEFRDRIYHPVRVFAVRDANDNLFSQASRVARPVLALHCLLCLCEWIVSAQHEESRREGGYPGCPE